MHGTLEKPSGTHIRTKQRHANFSISLQVPPSVLMAPYKAGLSIYNALNFTSRFKFDPTPTNGTFLGLKFGQDFKKVSSPSQNEEYTGKLRLLPPQEWHVTLGYFCVSYTEAHELQEKMAEVFAELAKVDIGLGSVKTTKLALADTNGTKPFNPAIWTEFDSRSACLFNKLSREIERVGLYHTAITRYTSRAQEDLGHTPHATMVRSAVRNGNWCKTMLIPAMRNEFNGIRFTPHTLVVTQRAHTSPKQVLPPNLLALKTVASITDGKLNTHAPASEILAFPEEVILPETFVKNGAWKPRKNRP